MRGEEFFGGSPNQIVNALVQQSMLMGCEFINYSPKSHYLCVTLSRDLRKETPHLIIDFLRGPIMEERADSLNEKDWNSSFDEAIPAKVILDPGQRHIPTSRWSAALR